MYYQGGNGAKYQMADRMRQAERARVAREVARSKGPGKTTRVATMVLTLVALPFKR